MDRGFTRAYERVQVPLSLLPETLEKSRVFFILRGFVCRKMCKNESPFYAEFRYTEIKTAHETAHGILRQIVGGRKPPIPQINKTPTPFIDGGGLFYSGCFKKDNAYLNHSVLHFNLLITCFKFATKKPTFTSKSASNLHLQLLSCILLKL